MSKILVLFTGGTIGSIKLFDQKSKRYIIMQPNEARKKGYDVKDSVSLLLDEFKRQYPNYKEEFITKIVMETLSENMTLDIWTQLTRDIKKYNFEDYDGVIITHGTDTLGYTANYLAMILSNIKVPLVLVSSNYEITDARANGIKNFKGAIDFIKNVSLPGVYATYNYDAKTKVIYGSRMTQCKQITDDFQGISIHTPNMCPLGIIRENGSFDVMDQELYNTLCNKKGGMDLLKQITRLNSRILKVSPYVGMNYECISLTNQDAVLHTLYHSGTVCSDNLSNSSVLNFIKRCKKNSVDLYFGPMYGKTDRDIYSSTSNFFDCNILMNISEENAYVKLLLAYELFANTNDRIDFIYSNVNEEYIRSAVRLKSK